MKRICLLVLFAGLSLYAVDIKWYHSYKSAVSASKKLNKPIFMMYSMST